MEKLGQAIVVLFFSLVGENLYAVEGEKLINCGAITKKRQPSALSPAIRRVQLVHKGLFIRSFTLHFCKRLFPQLNTKKKKEKLNLDKISSLSLQHASKHNQCHSDYSQIFSCVTRKCGIILETSINFK